MNQKQILQAFFSKQSDAVQQVIKRTCIVDFGVIVKVMGENVIKVGISVADNPEDIQIITCTLVNFCSSSVAVNVEAVEGDKVLVVFPRHYNPKMFNVKTKDPIIDSTLKGYSRYAGLAMLVNQFNKSSYKTTVTVNKDNEITVDNGKAKVMVDKNGNVSIEAQGKYTIKNNATDLKDVIDGLAKELENLTTVGSPATQATSPASKGTITAWRTGKLEQLLK